MVSAFLISLIGFIPAAPTAAAPGDVFRVSVATGGAQATGGASSELALSADGRFIAFESSATNLVANDTNGQPDIFVHDRQTQQTTRVSVATGGAQGNGASARPAISTDGRFVAFESNATNLVADDTNGQPDIFRHDRQTGQTIRISISSGGGNANGVSFFPSISADGLIVAFESSATNLVANDTNGQIDVFIRMPAEIMRVSVASDGTQANNLSFAPSISADGRSIAFASNASNLAAGDTNGTTDVFVHDRQTGQTTRVSVSSGGAQGNGFSFLPVISADGRVVAFESAATNLVAGDTNGAADIFVHDRQTQQTTRVSVTSSGAQGNGASQFPSISPDGMVVAFTSAATNLVAGDTNGQRDAFVHDRRTERTTRVSLSIGGAQGDQAVPLISRAHALSADGRIVAFASAATNLTPGDTNSVSDIFVHERRMTVTSRVSIATGGAQAIGGGLWSLSLSADGRYVAFDTGAANLVAGDTNNHPDVFVHDRQTRQTTRVSVSSGGAQGNGFSSDPFMSADGQVIAFISNATNLVAGDTNGVLDVFVHDRQTGQTTRVSVASDGAQANDEVSLFAMSDDGRHVAFSAYATNLVANDTNGVLDIFVHDRQTGQTTCVSVASDGAQANNASFHPAISADGRYVAFVSDATNLVAGDTNGVLDVFVHDRQTGQTTRVSVASDGAQANGASYVHPSPPAISADGRIVAFASAATNLVTNDTNTQADIFVHDRQTGQTTRVSVASDGTQANGASRYTAVSPDGRFVVFSSSATNLVAGDTNGVDDVFMHDRLTGQTIRISVGTGGAQANGASERVDIARFGWTVAFVSNATNLVEGDTNGVGDVFVHDLPLTNVALPLVTR
jgi:Tol biopolymer transport system component